MIHVIEGKVEVHIGKARLGFRMSPRGQTQRPRIDRSSKNRVSVKNIHGNDRDRMLENERDCSNGKC